MYKPGDVLRQQFRLEQQLGIGGFSEVWKATDLDAQDVVAIKIFLKQDEEGIDLCRKEFQRLNYLRHPNILRPRFFSHAEDAPFFVMPYCECGSAMDRAGELDEQTLARLITQVVSALHHIHTLPNPILHNDLKPDNILEEQPGLYVLADFGLSDRLSKKLTQSVPDDQRTERINSERRAGMTPMAYRAPELYNYSGRPKQPPSQATDIWALGASLYQLASDNLPFDKEGGLRQMTYYDTKSDLNLDDIIAPLPDNFSREFDALLKQCLDYDPAKRPTAKQLLEKAEGFLQNGKWDVELPVIPKGGRKTIPKTPSPVTPERKAGIPTIKIGPSGDSRPGNVELSTDRAEIDFGAVRLRQNATDQFEVSFKGLQGRVHIAVTPPFLVSLPQQPLMHSLDIPVFDQQGSQVIEVHFEPQEEQAYEGELYVSHPDHGQEMLPLRGEGSTRKSPFVWWHYAAAGGAVVLAFVAWMLVPRDPPAPAPPLPTGPEDTTVVVVPPPIVSPNKPSTSSTQPSTSIIPPITQPIGPLPFAVVLVAPDSVEVGKQITFEDRTETGVKIRSRSWDMGDGTAPLRQNKASVQYTYRQEGSYVMTLCINDTVCEGRMVRVVKPAGPPPICNPELDCSHTDVTGTASSDRCGTDDAAREWSSSAQIILKPQRNLHLKGAVAFADHPGTLMLVIRENGAKCEESFRQNVAQGRNQIGFVRDFTLQKGRTYTLYVSTKESDISARSPKLENLKSCNPGIGKTKDLVVDYQGNFILLDIKYCY